MASISQYKGLNRNTGQAITALQHLVQSLHDLLMTPIGTRVMRRDYGSLLPFLLDQPMTPVVLAKMRATIVHAITKWEPRVIPASVYITASSTGITVAIDYKTTDNRVDDIDTQTIKLEGLVA